MKKLSWLLILGLLVGALSVVGCDDGGGGDPGPSKYTDLP